MDCILFSCSSQCSRVLHRYFRNVRLYADLLHTIKWAHLTEDFPLKPASDFDSFNLGFASHIIVAPHMEYHH